MEGDVEEFQKRLDDINKTESDGDNLRRDIETKLYTETLIPESRGDVLGLLESCDRVLNITAETLNQFYVEQPFILEELKPKYIELANISIASLEEMVSAVRAYFINVVDVKDHVNKVQLYETESDKIAMKIKYEVFRSDLDLCKKMHMRYFALHIENIADEAEDVCDRLSIAVIKRSL